MFCNNCGTQLPDNAAFCANCGAAQNVQQAAPEQPQYSEPQYNQPQYSEPQYNQPPVYNATPVDNSASASSILTKGILAVALSEFGIPGIILGAMAKNAAAQYVAMNGQTTGKVKTGSILGKVGFGLGIGMTVFWAIYIIVIIGLLGI